MNDASGSDGSDEKRRTHRLLHGGDGSVATTIVLSIADIDDVDPSEMEPLYGAVDPVLLEAMIRDDRPVSADVMFNYRDYRVTVDSDGAIVISPLATCDDP